MQITGGLLFLRRASTTTASRQPAVFSIPPSTSVFRYGDRRSSTPLLRDVDLTIEFGQRWAVVGSGAERKNLVEVLLSHHRLSPPVSHPGRYPFLDEEKLRVPASSLIHHLTFSLPPSSTGEFSDYTARYHSLLESDRLTLLDKMLFLLDPDPLLGGKKGGDKARAAARRVGIEHLLDVPFVGLSNGQTRRARLAIGLLKAPRLLIVEEPFAGLDPEGRKDISRVLEELDADSKVILVVKGGEQLPEWVTHVAEATKDGGVRTGVRGDEKRWWNEKMEIAHRGHQLSSKSAAEAGMLGEKEAAAQGEREEVVRMTSVDVSYSGKKVLDDVSWTIRTGDRWHLQGHNGSGKTTVLSLLLGDHPRSYSLPTSSLLLFQQPRRKIATPTLNALMGHSSPEIFKAFPRGNMSVLNAVGTGFQGIFSKQQLAIEQKDRVRALLEEFFPDVEGGIEAFEREKFADQTPATQATLLFCRAVVGRPKLLILDEPFNAMDEIGMERCRLHLRNIGRGTAVIWVGHIESDRPWRNEDGQILRLAQGKVVFRQPE